MDFPFGYYIRIDLQVNDLDSSDSSMTEATSLGYLKYPPPAVFVTSVHPRKHINLSSELHYMSLPLFFIPSCALDESRVELQHASHDFGSAGLQAESSATVQVQADTNATEYSVYPTLPNRMRIGISNLRMDGMGTDETVPAEGSQHENPSNVLSFDGLLHGLSRHTANREDLSEFGEFHQFVPSRDQSGWELPFLQGWLTGQGQVGVPSMSPDIGGSHDCLPQQIGSSSMASNTSTTNVEVVMLSSQMPDSISIPGASVRSGLRNHFSQFHSPVSDSGNLTASTNIPHDGSDSQTIISQIQSELAASVSAAELPCTVKLKVWSHDLKNPCAPLHRCRLTIPHAVLCRYLLKL